MGAARLNLNLLRGAGTMSLNQHVKTILFVVASLSIALAVVLGAGGCHRSHGPQVLRARGTLSLASSPAPSSALEAGRDKGAPALAGLNMPPPAVGATPSPADRPLGMPYRHDGARIEHSASTGVPGTDPRQDER
jgi:hypothetical protein